MSVLVFDTETDGIGGFDPPTQRVVQLAWDLDGHTTSHLIRDVAAINPAVPHSITVEDCRERGVDFEEAFAGFMDALRRCDIVVAHNMHFDEGELLHELRLRNIPDGELFTLIQDKCRLCTKLATTEFCQLPKTGAGAKYGGYKWPTLGELYFKLVGAEPQLQLHDAYNDVKVLRECVTLMQANPRFAECFAG